MQRGSLYTLLYFLPAPATASLREETLRASIVVAYRCKDSATKDVPDQRLRFKVAAPTKAIMSKPTLRRVFSQFWAFYRLRLGRSLGNTRFYSLPAKVSHQQLSCSS